MYAIFHSSGISFLAIHKLNKFVKGGPNSVAQCLRTLELISIAPGDENSSMFFNSAITVKDSNRSILNLFSLDNFFKDVVLNNLSMYSIHISWPKKVNLLITEAK